MKKLVLMGTNDWVVPVFERISQQHEVVAVFTRAPKPAGRMLVLQKSPMHIWAESRGIPIHTSIKEFSSLIHHPSSIDFVVVASYGVMIPDDILSMSKFINIHPSLLPKYRGASPMLTAILNGDVDTGICLMDITSEMDAGDIHMVRKIAIGEDDTNADLEKNVSAVSADMLSEYLAAPDKYPAKPQIGEPTYTRKFTKEDLNIDWKKTPVQIHNQVRSIGGRTKINGIDVKILKTRIENGELKIENLQPAGKKAMDWKSFVNGLRDKIISFDN